MLDIVHSVAEFCSVPHLVTAHTLPVCTSRLVSRRFVEPCTIERRFAHRAGDDMDPDRRDEAGILAWLMEDDSEDIEDSSIRADGIESDRGSEHSDHFTDTEQSSSEAEGEVSSISLANQLCYVGKDGSTKWNAPAKSSAKQTLPYQPLLEPFRRIFRPLFENLWIRPERRNFRPDNRRSGVPGDPYLKTQEPNQTIKDRHTAFTKNIQLCLPLYLMSKIEGLKYLKKNSQLVSAVLEIW
ncbi:hypothetical protein EVAR_87745_1 [Eumeta japonica]|uniref:Uncharacterized protein n=1 Tax=Eumeta variegata TaxID=151549 RepID=A0A4C1ZP10_EUMVA|nr:hypothetical protein EVAR_87745_1 [Eumeta japonica]